MPVLGRAFVRQLELAVGLYIYDYRVIGVVRDTNWLAARGIVDVQLYRCAASFEGSRAELTDRHSSYLIKGSFYQYQRRSSFLINTRQRETCRLTCKTLCCCGNFCEII